MSNMFLRDVELTNFLGKYRPGRGKQCLLRLYYGWRR